MPEKLTANTRFMATNAVATALAHSCLKLFHSVSLCLAAGLLFIITITRQQKVHGAITETRNPTGEWHSDRVTVRCHSDSVMEYTKLETEPYSDIVAARHYSGVVVVRSQRYSYTTLQQWNSDTLVVQWQCKTIVTEKQ